MRKSIEDRAAKRALKHEMGWARPDELPRSKATAALPESLTEQHGVEQQSLDEAERQRTGMQANPEGRVDTRTSSGNAVVSADMTSLFFETDEDVNMAAPPEEEEEGENIICDPDPPPPPMKKSTARPPTEDSAGASEIAGTGQREKVAQEDGKMDRLRAASVPELARWLLRENREEAPGEVTRVLAEDVDENDILPLDEDAFEFRLPPRPDEDEL